jgi:transcriptional regulator with XRE-family HTH domain
MIVGAHPGRARPGEWIRQRRVAAGLTQEELAERSGLSVRAIADLERGRTRRPYPSSVRALARALGLPDSAGAELVARYRAGGDYAAGALRAGRGGLGGLGRAEAFCRKARYELALALALLGDAYVSTGDVPAAREAWRESAEILEALHHPAAGEVRAKLTEIPAR